MLDVIFISYDEPNADHNFALLQDKVPFARRVNGIEGIHSAHMKAAEKSNTSFFYVVDGDSVIRDDFNFDYVPPDHKSEYVHIWKAFTPAVNLTYGYGGVKLFHKKFFNEIKSYVDFSTTLTKDVEYMDITASESIFNSDPLRAFRGAFRESFKLCLNIRTLTGSLKEEAAVRLNAWKNPNPLAPFSKYIEQGAADGIAYSYSHQADINNYQLLNTVLNSKIV